MATEYFNDAWRIPNNKNQSLVSNYSMDFDGSNYIDLGNLSFLSNVTEFSFSTWVNISTNTSDKFIFAGAPSRVAMQIFATELRVYIDNSGAAVNKYSNFATVDNWINIVLIYDGSESTPSDRAKIYKNGILISPSVTGSLSSTTPTYTGNTYLGSFSTSPPTGGLNGKIDQVTFFDYALSATQVATLYGGGTAVTNPMTLSPKPVAYYQLGDQSVDNGANYLVPNNSLNGSEGYSPYALSLDSNDANYFTLNNGGGNGLLNAATSLTISAWINIAATSTYQNIFTRFFGGVMFRVLGTNGNLQLYLTREDNTYLLIQALNAVSFNEWQHLAATWDGSTVKLYVNNVEVIDASFSDTLKNDTSNNSDLIGNRVGTTQYFNGKISNVAIWKNSVIDVNTLYNQGVPADLTSLNPSGWWQMGSNSSFDANTSKWTCLNEGTTRTSAVPSNATTFAGNMTNDDIVNGVGYSANGLGTSSIEIVGDAPYSTANGISVNMDVLDRTTDVPS